MNGQDLESGKHCGNTNEFGGLHSLWRIEQEKTRLVEFNKETYNAVTGKNIQFLENSAISCTPRTTRVVKFHCLARR